MKKAKIIVIGSGDCGRLCAIKAALEETHEVITSSDNNAFIEEPYTTPILIVNAHKFIEPLRLKRLPKGHKRPYKYHK